MYKAKKITKGGAFWNNWNDFKKDVWQPFDNTMKKYKPVSWLNDHIPGGLTGAAVLASQIPKYGTIAGNVIGAVDLLRMKGWGGSGEAPVVLPNQQYTAGGGFKIKKKGKQRAAFRISHKKH